MKSKSQHLALKTTLNDTPSGVEAEHAGGRAGPAAVHGRGRGPVQAEPPRPGGAPHAHRAAAGAETPPGDSRQVFMQLLVQKIVLLEFGKVDLALIIH